MVRPNLAPIETQARTILQFWAQAFPFATFEVKVSSGRTTGLFGYLTVEANLTMPGDGSAIPAVRHGQIPLSGQTIRLVAVNAYIPGQTAPLAGDLYALEVDPGGINKELSKAKLHGVSDAYLWTNKVLNDLGISPDALPPPRGERQSTGLVALPHTYNLLWDRSWLDARSVWAHPEDPIRQTNYVFNPARPHRLIVRLGPPRSPRTYHVELRRLGDTNDPCGVICMECGLNSPGSIIVAQSSRGAWATVPRGYAVLEDKMVEFILQGIEQAVQWPLETMPPDLWNDPPLDSPDSLDLLDLL